MPISVRCQCGSQYQVADSLAGTSAKCKCGATVQIPVVGVPVAGDESLYNSALATNSNSFPTATGPRVLGPRTLTTPHMSQDDMTLASYGGYEKRAGAYEDPPIFQRWGIHPIAFGGFVVMCVGGALFLLGLLLGILHLGVALLILTGGILLVIGLFMSDLTRLKKLLNREE